MGSQPLEMAYWSGNLVRDLLEALTDNPARVSERTELETESPESLKGAWRERSHKDYVSTEMQWNRLVVNLWSKMSLFCSMKEGVSYLFLSATTYLLFCHVQPPPRSAVPHVCCRPSNGRKMQALTAVEWLTAVRYETDGRLANGWTDGLPENRLTGLGSGLPLTLIQTWWRMSKRSLYKLHSL